MQQVFRNLFQSKARLMVILRYILFISIIFMGIQRFRIIFSYLQSSATYNNRDVLTYYLIAKAVVAHINPYLPLNELVKIFVGDVQFFPHPAPCTPFLTILFTPFTHLTLEQLTIGLFIFESALLVLLAGLSTILFKGRMNWKLLGIFLVILVAWYPVANDLAYGQLSILLTVLVLGALLAMEKKKGILAGVLIGLSVAIKLITWPLIIYYLIKKDWRGFISSSLTAIGLNVLALIVIGIDPFRQYYLQVSRQVLAVYQAVMHNLSLWSIGFRVFSGTGSTTFPNFINAPALIDKPELAPIFSGILVIIVLFILAWYSFRIKDTNLSYSLVVCGVLLVSPITWAHYYVLLIIPLLILYQSLQGRSFPPRQTLVFTILCLLLFLFNEQIQLIVILINGGNDYLASNGYHIAFTSSLLTLIPTLEIVSVCILIYLRGIPAKISPCYA